MKANITFKSLLDPIKDIKKRNEYFNYLSDEGKLMEMAWDAVKLIHKGILEGSWRIYWDDLLMQIKGEANDSCELQRKFLSLSTPCEVCGRGALMVARIRLGNGLVPSDSRIINGAEYIIGNWMYNEFLRIEREYEHSSYQLPYRNNTTEKLLNIFCNILVNGYFNTDDKTNYLIP